MGFLEVGGGGGRGSNNCYSIIDDLGMNLDFYSMFACNMYILYIELTALEEYHFFV
jgi:hypothetical protein